MGRGLVLTTRMPRRLHLINPRYRFKHYAAQAEMARLLGRQKMQVPLQLPLLAALTPPSWQVRIIDDETDPLPAEVPALAGITTLSATSGRAYELAALYRARGAKVVLGGSYVTFMVEEALQHADSVVVGEAEETWPRLLADAAVGRLQRVYRADAPPPFHTSPPPRWELLDKRQMMSVGVETSRGCPFDCAFCMVHTMFGRKMRLRAPEDVVREIRAAPLKRLFFVADNFALRKGYARELVGQLRGLGISWVCQTGIDIADQPDLLQAMAEAGCISILIGFESLNPAVMGGFRKNQDHLSRYAEVVRRIHAQGMHVLASFVVGFDADELSAFDRIREFVEANDIVYPMLNVLSVSPGSPIHARLAKAGRLGSLPAEYRNGMFPCVHYYRMGQRELLEKYFQTLRALFSTESFRARALRLFGAGGFRREAVDSVPLLEKVTTSATVLRRFLLGRDRAKRDLFLKLLALARQGGLAMDKLVLFLLTMQAFQDFLGTADGYLDEVRATLARTDQGPWLASHPDDPPLLVGEDCGHSTGTDADPG